MKISTLSDISLTSSTIPEDRYQGSATANGEWIVTTAYVQDDVVYYTGVEPHRVYTLLAASDTGTVPGTDAAIWGNLGSTDRWLMFDEYINTQSTDTTSITVVLDSSGTNSIGLFNLTALEVELTVVVDAVTIKTEIINLRGGGGPSWYEYFFSAFDSKEKVYWEYPQYSTSELTVTITYVTGEQVGCGQLAVGKAFEIGDTLYTPDIGIEDYSFKDTDPDFGNTFLNQGNYADTGNFKLWVENNVIDSIHRTLVKNRGVAAIYDFNNEGTDFESLLIYGFFESFTINISGPISSRISLTIQGLI